MPSLVCTSCDGEGFVGRGRRSEACGLCEDGYRLCVRCEHGRAQEEHYLDGEGHVCDSCATRYYERQPVESLTDEQLEFLEYTPAEIKAIRRKASMGFPSSEINEEARHVAA